MTDISVEALSYRYGNEVDALHDISFDAPSGAIMGLLGANAAGKTTLLQCCAGLRKPNAGRVIVGGQDAASRALIVSGVIGYVAEGVRLPSDMTLAQLERWLAPLHARWDAHTAASLRERFALDDSRRLSTLSRGEYVKAALLCTLAARPRVLLMDEPFTGIDVVTKDEIVRALLATSTAGEMTVVIASHDIAEIESVMSHAVILNTGRVQVAGSMERIRERYRRVTMVGGDDILAVFAREQAWLEIERAGRLVSVVADSEQTPLDHAMLSRRFSGADSITIDDLSLRELFTSVVRSSRNGASRAEAA